MTDEGAQICNEINVVFKDSWKGVKDLTRNSDQDKR
jgi:hypothetical protein